MTKSSTAEDFIPDDHPRSESLRIRHKLIEGFEKGLVAKAGLIAHGRGEAFDYLIGERTIESARKAIEASVAQMLLCNHPVISVNGNVAALVPEEIVELSKVVSAPLEVNLFYRSRERELAIEKALIDAGAKQVLGVDLSHRTLLHGISHQRRHVDDRGIAKADAVLVMLEDGDRTIALRAADKFVVAIDLNPLSRTALAGSFTIVDNLIRSIPLMTKTAEQFIEKDSTELEQIVATYSHQQILEDALKVMGHSYQQVAPMLKSVIQAIEAKRKH